MSTRFVLMSGFLLPIVFVAFVWIDAALTPGYSHISDTVSDLAEQGKPHAFVMRFGMIICAALLALFTAGLLRVLPTHRHAIRIELFGVSVMIALAGIFQDWGPDPGGKRNLEGFLHTTAATMMIGLFMSVMVTVAIAAKAESSPSVWSAMFQLSIRYGLVLTLLCLGFVFGPEHIEGLIQRGIFLAALAWLVTLTDVSLHADRSNTEHRREESNTSASVAGERSALLRITA